MDPIKWVFCLLIWICAIESNAQIHQFSGKWYQSFRFDFRPTDTVTKVHYYFKTELSKAHYRSNMAQGPAFAESYYVFNTNTSKGEYIRITKYQYSIDRSRSDIDLDNYYVHDLVSDNYTFDHKNDTLFIKYENDHAEYLRVIHIDEKVLIVLKDYSGSQWVEVFLKAGINDREFYEERGKYFIVPILKKYCETNGLPEFVVKE